MRLVVAREHVRTKMTKRESRVRKPSLSTSREHLDPVVPEDDHARLFNGSSYIILLTQDMAHSFCL